MGLVTVWGTWPFAQQIVIPAQARIPLAALGPELWNNRGDLSAYLAWRWKPLIDWNYPYAFLLAVGVGLLIYGLLLSLLRKSWVSLLQVAIGGVVGGAVGYGLMTDELMPNALTSALAMPGLALFIGFFVPALFMPSRGPNTVRGTRITPYRASHQGVAQRAIRKKCAALVGVLLSAKDETQHLAVVGVTGSGKSVAIRGLLHTTVSRGDRHVVADPDGGAMRLFHQDGDVILNPADARSAKWDLLAEIEEDSDYRLLAEAVVPFPKEDQGSEWVMYAREVFATCLETWHQNRLGSSDAFFQAMATADREKLATLCEGTAAHRYFETGNDKMLGSIMGTLAPAVGNMRQLARLQGAPFSVRRWIREGSGTLWMPYRAKQIPALRGLISCWMGLAISEALSLPESRTRRIWFHIDELDALGRIQGLKDALARLRKVGGCAVLGFQSIAQVRAVYGEAEAHTIVENCDNKLILRCGSSEGGGTAKFASQVIGEREVERDETSISQNQGRNTSSSTSRSVRRNREPAVMDSEITQLADCTGYLKIASRPNWLKVSFKPITFSAQVEPYVTANQISRPAGE